MLSRLDFLAPFVGLPGDLVGTTVQSWTGPLVVRLPNIDELHRELFGG